MTVLSHWFGCTDADRVNLALINGLTPETNDLVFSDKVTVNWEAVEPHFRNKGDNCKRGALLELTICSALIESGVSPQRIRRNVKLAPGDIDILVKDCPILPYQGISVKVSSRERWAIADRDCAILMNEKYTDKVAQLVGAVSGKQINSWYLTWKEQVDTSVVAAVNHVRSLNTKCAFIPPGNCMSVLDRERMNNLFYNITGKNQ